MSVSTFQQMFNPSDSKVSAIHKQIQLKNGAIYCGELINGKPQGRGILTYVNKQKYQGEFHLGLKHGKGEFYIGDWFENKKHGKGQYFYDNGKRYTGEFVNNMKHGWGKIEEDNGAYYEGYFYENNKDRTGEYYNPQEDRKYLQLYQNGKLIEQRQIIVGVNVHPSENQDEEQGFEVLELNKNQSKKTKQKQGDQIRQICSHDARRPEPITSSNQKPNYISYCEPIVESLRNLDSRVRLQQSNPTLIAENYFSSSLLGKKISLWNQGEVSNWLNQIGFGDCIQEFKDHNIQGDTLLILDNDDLKQLNVGALGDRRILLRQIEFLKLIFKSQCLGDSISKLYHHDVSLELVRDLETKKDQRQQEKKKMIEAVQSDTSSSSEDQVQIKKSKKAQLKHSNSISMKCKVQNYLEKKGIKLTFLIPKDQIEIVRPIGKGGYGQVFEGKWLGQPVAVKKYLKKQGFRNRHVANFIQEIQVINRLLHPCIVLYMGMCIYDNEYGMITQFLSGGSLFDYLHKDKKALTQEQIFYICKDVALGMSYLHGKNVLHCDLKSSNVLIDESQHVKLCDFGLSRIQTTKGKKNSQNNRVGTPHWMAPETLRGQKYQFESDVYSYGILLWQMLTKQIPYKDLSTAQIIGMVGNDKNHQISMPEYQNQLFLGIFKACTDRDPKKRPSFKAIVTTLEKQQQKYRSLQDKMYDCNELSWL